MTPLEYAEMARSRWQAGERPRGYGQEGFQPPPWLQRLRREVPHFLQQSPDPYSKQPSPVPPGVDSVPAMLTPTEAVLNPGAAALVGPPAVNALNDIGKRLNPTGAPVRGYQGGGWVEPDILRGNLGTEAGGLRATSDYWDRMNAYDYAMPHWDSTNRPSLEITGGGSPYGGLSYLPFAGYKLGPTAYPTSFKYDPSFPGGYAARAMPASLDAGIGWGGGFSPLSGAGFGTPGMGGSLGPASAYSGPSNPLARPFLDKMFSSGGAPVGLKEGGMVPDHPQHYQYGGVVSPYTDNRPQWEQVQFSSPGINYEQLRAEAKKSLVDPNAIGSLLKMILAYKPKPTGETYQGAPIYG